MIGSPEKYTAYEINDNQNLITKGFSPEAKVYGSFIIKSDYVTIDGLTIYTHGGVDGLLQSAIDVITRNVTISNNTIELPNPETLAAGGGTGNGITIWPYGHPDESPRYFIYGNTFKGYTGDTENWSSTAMQVVEEMSLDTFGFPYIKSYQANFYNDQAEVNMVEGNAGKHYKSNTYISCTNIYIRTNWRTDSPITQFIYELNTNQLD